MKRMLFVVVAGITLSSCTKDYTCTCTSVKPNGNVTGVETKTISGRRSKAEEKCKQFDNINGDVTTTCQVD